MTFVTTDARDEKSRLTDDVGISEAKPLAGEVDDEAPSARGRDRWRRPITRTVEGVTRQIFPNVSNRAAYHAQCSCRAASSPTCASTPATFDVAHLHACRNVPRRDGGALTSAGQACRTS